MHKDIETFHDLQLEVVQGGLCSGCGSCVSFCSMWRQNALEIGETDLPRYADEDSCLQCGICYRTCPQTEELDSEVHEKHGSGPSSGSPPIGAYPAITLARATDTPILDGTTDGEVVTSLLLYMLERRLINGAVVFNKGGLCGQEPLIATTREQLIQSARSRFSRSRQLGSLGENWGSAASSWGKEGPTKLAIVGTPCQIKAVRKLQCLRILPADAIDLTIGLFCMQSFPLDVVLRERLEKRLALSADIVRLWIADEFIVTLSNGVRLHMPFDEVEEVPRPACKACTDFTNEYADISIGWLASREGYSTILTRTEDGGRAYSGALRKGYLEERAFKDAQELRIEKAKMLRKLLSFAKPTRNLSENALTVLDKEATRAPAAV